MKKTILTFLAFFAAAWSQAETLPATPRVLPWNGHKAAVSLTFDDSDPSHLAVAIPELNRRHLKGTFFLIANRTAEKDEWRKAFQAGQELGNHSLDHLHPAGLTPGQEESQVAGAQAVLQKTFGLPIYCFAYPFTEITPGILGWVQKNCFIARGGYGQYDMKPADEPDWFNIPARVTLTALPLSTYQGWIDEDFQQGAWMVFMIHGLEGTPWGYEPIKTVVFDGILDALQAKDIWVDSFSAVGAYWKAQKVFEKAAPTAQNGEFHWTWDIPANFPEHVALKLQLPPGTGLALYQGATRLLPDAQGVYTLSFDGKELTEKPLAAN
ncbi:MAG TPA: polysaccharide deacetylase family protein [bacterium]|nr:polysaccharide deacetylase family protein [bacterium]